MQHCGYCGKAHEDIPTDLAYRRPVQYFFIPENERANRCMESDDLCVIDGKTFLVRGVIEVPVIDTAETKLTWGMWASISRTSFDRCYELFDKDGSNEPPFRGLLSCSPKGYPELYDHEVVVHLRGPTDRPIFIPESYDHPLFIEQRDGITTHRWHEIITTAMPWLVLAPASTSGPSSDSAR